MKKFEIVPHHDQSSELWDQNIKDSVNFCLMGTRKFLSYHKNRFIDQSISIYDQGRWVASLPAAVDLKNPTKVVSHPGATFGGVYFHKDIRGKDQLDLLHQCLNYYRGLGFKELSLRPVPTFYRREPVEDDFFGIYQNGGKIEFCRPTSTISLQQWGPLSVTKGRKSSRNKAALAGVEIRRGFEFLDPFWITLVNNLKLIHQATPVHSIDEMKDLINRFPESLELFVALKDSEVLAGALCFSHTKVFHTQYMSNTTLGRKISALDFVIYQAISFAKDKNMSYFDFGTSQCMDGSIDEDLYFYKQSFGAGSFCHWAFHFEL